MDLLTKGISGTFLNSLSGWDWLIAGIIVLIVEYGIKTIFRDEKYKWLWKVAPIVIGVIGYVIYALVSKSVWYQGVLRGFEVGLIAMGYYDIILKTIKQTGKKGLEDTNKAIEEAVKKGTNK